jgi:hypothetical protein
MKRLEFIVSVRCGKDIIIPSVCLRYILVKSEKHAFILCPVTSKVCVVIKPLHTLHSLYL